MNPTKQKSVSSTYSAKQKLIRQEQLDETKVCFVNLLDETDVFRRAQFRQGPVRAQYDELCILT
ncbi:hypothetical protein HanOQP8_Chr10g0363941 [Helianthus annuus]|nr:hypothetical protein HanOQP8_Chr10g0363941 [Helianthus annuus]